MEMMELAQALQDSGLRRDPDGSDECFIYLQILDRLSRKVCGGGNPSYGGDAVFIRDGEFFAPGGMAAINTCDEMFEHFYGDVFLPFALDKGPYRVCVNRLVDGGFDDEDVSGLMQIYERYSGGEEISDYLPQHFVSVYHDGEHMDEALVDALWEYVTEHGLLGQLGFMDYACSMTDYDVMEHVCYVALFFASAVVQGAYDDGMTLTYTLFMSPALNDWISYMSVHTVDDADWDRTWELLEKVADWIKSDLPVRKNASGGPFFLGSIEDSYCDYGWEEGKYFGIYSPCIYGVFLELKCLLKDFDEKYGYLAFADGRKGDGNES